MVKRNGVVSAMFKIGGNLIEVRLNGDDPGKKKVPRPMMRPKGMKGLMH